jgi:hypothetical protein
MTEHKNLGRMDDQNAQSGKPRVAFASLACYFDTYNEASVAMRSLMECLATWGFPAKAMTGTVFDAGKELDPGNWLAEQGLMPEFFDGQANCTWRGVRHSPRSCLFPMPITVGRSPRSAN